MDINDLIIEINRLKLELSSVKQELKKLTADNLYLREELAVYQTPKHSGNSSIPPSKDENRPKPNQSLRKPSGKKPGGQLGRKGTTLKMTKTPDKIIELHPEYCFSCGGNLSDKVSKKNSVRQVIDIPPIKAIYTEYQSFKKVCDCGCTTTANFPKAVNVPISYGSQSQALIAYFHARQYIPFSRMKELFNDVFGLAISEGGIHYLLDHFAQKSTYAYQTIKQRISTSNVIGTDETGVKVNGDKHWFWTWQTNKLTFITHSDNRGGATITKHFPNGFTNSTLVHDGWRAQLNTTAKNHQTCLPHLLRRLNYLNEKYPSTCWGKLFLQLLYDALELKKTITTQWNGAKPKQMEIIKRREALLEKPPDKINKELYTFYKRMARERQHLFTFLFLQDVPPDNNASERAIRNVKVKQKISGQFKKQEKAQNFAKIRSIIDTTIKNGQNVVQALAVIANSQLKIKH